MTRFYDGTKVLEISIQEIDDCGRIRPDLSEIFFSSDPIKLDPDVDDCRVDDVDYILRRALDWKYTDGADPNIRLVRYAVAAAPYMIPDDWKEE